jgi:hypothetical protein
MLVSAISCRMFLCSVIMCDNWYISDSRKAISLAVAMNWP